MNIILKSKAFWTALISFAGVVVMRYTNVPSEIWESFIGLAFVVVGLFAADEVGESISKNIVLGIRETMLELRKIDKNK